MERDAEGCHLTARISVRVDTGGVRRLQRIDWTTPYQRTASYLAREMATMFETEGASRGHPWQALAPSTVIRKARAGRSPRILQLTGRLRGSFRVLRLDKTGLVFGTDDPKAKYHDSDEPRSRLPQRKLIRVIERDRETFLQHLGDHVRATAAGGRA